MKSIIGLFNDQEAVSSTMERLDEAGVPADKINLLSSPNSVNKLLGCSPVCIVTNYTAWGAAIGASIYAIYGIAALFCECGIIQYGREVGLLALLGAALAGSVVGGVIGGLLGLGESEKDTQLYVQGVNFGGRVISIRVPDEDADRVIKILTNSNLLGVKAIEAKGV